MVAAGVAALDLHDHRRLHRVSDGEHLIDLAHGARFEGHPREVIGVELLHERDGLLERRDAGGDDDAGNRGAIRARLGHRAFAGDLAAPLRGREVHGVELGVDARLEELF